MRISKYKDQERKDITSSQTSRTNREKLKLWHGFHLPNLFKNNNIMSLKQIWAEQKNHTERERERIKTQY